MALRNKLPFWVLAFVEKKTELQFRLQQPATILTNQVHIAGSFQKPAIYGM
jgi:hypothetical protein